MSQMVLSSSNPGNVLDAPTLKLAPPVFRTLLRLLSGGWKVGALTMVTPEGAEIVIKGNEPGPEGRIDIRNYRFVRRSLTGGTIGFAEAYMDGDWETPDLSALLTVFSMNLDQISKVVEGNPLVRAWNFMSHLMHRNNRSGSKKNIHAHYDLGNAFYSQWLDQTMTYSSARFEHPGESLEEAQRNKYASLARSIDLQADQSVLEIGCGWGGFAEFAAKEVGARVTGITISQAQYDFARKRMFDQGLAEKADIQLIDYRDVKGPFDRVASIEMFEAVGQEYWPTYFGKIRDVLRPGGRAGLQIITIREEFFDTYRRNPDFIQKYIFPGGMLPSEERLKPQTDRAGLDWSGVTRFGQDYADTLAIWGKRFEGVWDDVRNLGFDERFHKLWRFYLSYCEAGFRTERTNVIQLALHRA